MDIDFKSYLSEEEIKNIYIEELRYKIHEELKYSNVSTVLSNLSYEIVFKKVCDILKTNEDSVIETIAEKVVDIINDLSSYSVFRRKDEYGNNQDSLAQKYLIEAVENNKVLIEDRVKELMIDFNLSYFKDDLQEKISEVIEERLFGKD